MKLPTVQDELLLDSLPDNIKKVINEIYGNRDDAVEAFNSGQIKAFDKAKENVKSWLRNNTKLPHTQILDLLKFIDT